MPFEDIQVRIKKNGTVHVKTGPITEERMRDIREMLEDCIGTVTKVEFDGDPSGGSVKIVEKGKVKKK